MTSRPEAGGLVGSRTSDPWQLDAASAVRAKRLGDPLHKIVDTWTTLSRALQLKRTFVASDQGRSHVFEFGGPIPWSRLLYRTKHGWYTQFRALQSAAA